jgi:hypothetical protein
MPIRSENNSQPDRCFGRGDADGKKCEYDPGQGRGVRAEAPECDEIYVGGIKHKFNSNKNKNGIAPDQYSGKPNGEEKRGQE